MKTSSPRIRQRRSEANPESPERNAFACFGLAKPLSFEPLSILLATMRDLVCDLLRNACAQRSMRYTEPGDLITEVAVWKPLEASMGIQSPIIMLA
jgi:hypothetical protein